MTIDIKVSTYGDRKFEEAVKSIREHPFRDEEQIDRFEISEDAFERRVETDSVETFFRELGNVPLELSSGIGGKGTVAEFRLQPDKEDYENMRDMVTELEEAGANVAGIWFTSNNGLGRGPRGDLEAADIPAYLDSLENDQHEIIIDAEKNGRRTAVKYNTDGYAVVREGRNVKTGERFQDPDKDLGFPLSEKLREKGVPIEWRKDSRQNIEYVESCVEYPDGTVSPEGELTPVPTCITGGNGYETGTRTYIVDGEERTGTVLGEKKEDWSLEDVADHSHSGGGMGG